MPGPTNPYQAPRSDLGPEAPSPSRRTGWKVYAYFLVALQLSGLYYGLAEMDAIRALDYSVTVVGVVGLFGFAYRRPILERWFWRPWSVAMPLWDIAMGAWVYPSQHPQFARETTTAYFVLMLLFVPEYLALIRYAYFSPEVWSKTPEKHGATAG
jgi:hypothetical protein